MATSINYKNKRSPRAITKFLPFNKGMFHNNHTIQEGFAKVLVNYDLDDAGLSVKPRSGKKYIDQVNVTGNRMKYTGDTSHITHTLGAVHVAGYLYDEERLRDAIISFGKYYEQGLIPLIKDFLPSLRVNNDFGQFVSKPGFYFGGGFYSDHHGNFAMSHAWTLTSRDFAYDAESNPDNPSDYKALTNEFTGNFITAKNLRCEELFGMESENPVLHYPITTLMNGEVYCFMGGSQVPHTATADEEFPPGIVIAPGVPGVWNPEQWIPIYATTLRKIKLKVSNNYTIPTDVIHDVPVEVTEIPLKQIQTTGFNMLKEAPYTSVHYGIVGSALSIDGVLLYSDAACTEPVRSPSKSGNTYLRLYATIDPTATYEIKWEYKNVTSSTWILKRDWTAVDFKTGGVFDPNKVISETFTGAHKTDKFEYRVTLRKTGLANTEVPYAPLPIECDNPELQKIEYQNFDLTTAEGMFGYKGSLGLYGVTSAKNTIFMSDVDNPGYFPFPNNIIVFDTDVLMVKPFNGNLLVVTLDGLHIITGGPDPTTMLQKQILSNTYITPLDAMNIQILKDQVFFKTNNQFYVLKPNAKGSDATDLKNYLNSQTIDGYLSNFKENTLKMLNDMYQPTLINKGWAKFHDIKFVDLSSGIYNGEVYYTIKCKPYLNVPEIGVYNPEPLLIHVIYNPITRTWRLHTEAIESQWADGINGTKHLNKSTNKYLMFEPFHFGTEILQSGAAPWFIRGVNVLQESDEVVRDSYQYANPFDPELNTGWDPLVIRKATDMTDALNRDCLLDNYQYIDTGNVMLDDTVFKRFREVQFSVYNTSKEVIPFYSNFYLDGVNKLNPLSYTVVHITDTNDPNYGKIFIEENVNYTGSFPENIEIPEDLDITENTEILGETALDFWELDLAAFPDLTTTTVRLTLTGKGRRARLVLLNTSLKQYELSNLAFVYRNMNAR